MTTGNAQAMADFERDPEALRQQREELARQATVTRSRQIDSFCRHHRVPEKMRGFLQNFYRPRTGR